MVNFLVLLLNVGHEVFSFVVKLELIYKGLEELPYLGDENNYDSDDDQVEECQLDYQKEDVYEQEENGKLSDSQWGQKVDWALSLSGLQVRVGLQFFNGF